MRRTSHIAHRFPRLPKEYPAYFLSRRTRVFPSAGTDLEAAIKANARIHAALLREASPVIGSLLKETKLKVVAGYYDVAKGTVTLLA